MLSEKSGAQEITREVNSADSGEKVDKLIDWTVPHIWKLSCSEQRGSRIKSVSMTMLDHSRISVRIHKSEKPEPTSISIYGFTDGQPTERAIIEIPTSGPERAEDVLGRIFESCGQNLKERQHILTFQPTPAQLEYLARVKYPTVSVTARLTKEEYWAMPGVHSVQGEMTCYMEAMLECYNGENPDSKYRGIQDPYSFTMEQISCVLRVIEECRFSYREICPEKGRPGARPGEKRAKKGKSE